MTSWINLCWQSNSHWTVYWTGGYLFLWTVAFSRWLAIVSGVDLARVKYAGLWTEGMSIGHNTNSFFGLIHDSYDLNHETNLFIRAFYHKFCLRTTLLFLLGYLIISKLSKSMLNGSMHRKVLIAARALYHMSIHEPLFGAGAIVIIEVRRTPDPLLIRADDCVKKSACWSKVSLLQVYFHSQFMRSLWECCWGYYRENIISNTCTRYMRWKLIIWQRKNHTNNNQMSSKIFVFKKSTVYFISLFGRALSFQFFYSVMCAPKC